MQPEGFAQASADTGIRAAGVATIRGEQLHRVRQAIAFLARHPDSSWEFFENVLRLPSDGCDPLEHLDAAEEQVLTMLFKSDPEAAWKIVAAIVAESGCRESWAIQSWLASAGLRSLDEQAPGAIRFAPVEAALAWVGEDVEVRGYWLAGALPRTLDPSPVGRLTREFILRFSENKSVHGSLLTNFLHREGWVGDESEHFRNLRQRALGWLSDERNETVRQWLQRYIEALGVYIDRGRIEEERRH